MVCPDCSGTIEPTQRFCNWCGTALHAKPESPAFAPPLNPAGDTAATKLVSEVDAHDDASPDEPSGVFVSTLGAPTELLAADEVGAEAPITVSEAVPSVVVREPVIVTHDETPAVTPFDAPAPTAQPATPRTVPMPAVTASAPADDTSFRVTPLLFIGIIGAIVTMVGMFANVVTISSNVPLKIASNNEFGFRVGQWRAIDLAGNLPFAGLIVAVGMIFGVLAASFGWRWGAGLAGGSGGAAVGLSLLTLGVAQFPIDAAQRLISVPSEQEFVLSITKDLGYWMQVAAAACGLLVLWASLSDAKADRRRSLNPWAAAFGALAVLVAAIGPMLPVKQGLFSDNWYLVNAVGEPSQLLSIARLVQIAIFAITGIVGFLMVNRYGLGLVFGATLAIAWLTVSTQLQLTPDPVGFAFRNPGATSMVVHGVTIIGIAATLAAALIACAAALEQSARGR